MFLSSPRVQASPMRGEMHTDRSVDRFRCGCYPGLYSSRLYCFAELELMRILDKSEIQPSEIDGLGHMNVRFYMERAQRANRVLMTEFGLGADAIAPARLVQHDAYCRYQREQFQGSTLTVNGGVLEASSDATSVFYELTNPAKGEIAATFIIANSLIDPATGETLPLPTSALAAAVAERIELPEHGRPRTIALGAPRLDLAFDEVAARLADDGEDPMSRRSEWTVEAAQCDEHGFLADTGAMMFGGGRMPSAEEMRRHGPMTFSSDEGHRLGWASLETRMVRVSQPRAGDRLCSIGAEIGLHPKVRHSRRWLFNAATGQLVSLNDNVSIALDLDARRSIEIPPSIRSKLETRHTPEFA
jgi:acyl-CoA thioester hydrolase